MKILVLMRMVPDIVEELDVAADGVSLDLEFLRLIVSERDEHALEQALILKERHDATLIVAAVDAPEVDDLLFTALAKGADRIVKITGVEAVGTAAMAATVAATLPSIPDALPADLILTGSRAIDDLDGMTAPLLAAALDLPYTGLLNAITVDPAAGSARVMKEYSGGVAGVFDVMLPAVLGVQGAEKPPRYVPIAKIRAAMGSGAIEEVRAVVAAGSVPVAVTALAKPEETGRAEMLTGGAEDVAERVTELLAERGLV